MMKPSATPTATAIAKPAIVTQYVLQACMAMGPANSISDCTMAAGPGKMNSEIPKALQTICQQMTVAISNTQGARTLYAFLFMVFLGAGVLTRLVLFRWGKPA